ncbi:MAG: hypothetical protein OXF33_01915 [Rhodospirillales bacterium]|nr:hypothetical protein [Rhodospirillales bacterium]
MRGFGAWAALVGCLLAVVAGADAAIFQRVSDGKAETSSDVIARIDRLAAEQASGRRDFETRGAYQARIAQAEEALKDLESVQYWLSMQPTSTRLDWENSVVQIRFILPMVVLRERGGSQESNEIRLSYAASPDQVRLMDTFPRSITLRLVFGVSRAKRMLIESMTLRFQGDIIYEEP